MPNIDRLSAGQLRKLAVADKKRGDRARALLVRLRTSGEAVTKSGRTVAEFSRNNPEA